MNKLILADTDGESEWEFTFEDGEVVFTWNGEFRGAFSLDDLRRIHKFGSDEREIEK